MVQVEQGTFSISYQSKLWYLTGMGKRSAHLFCMVHLTKI